MFPIWLVLLISNLLAASTSTASAPKSTKDQAQQVDLDEFVSNFDPSSLSGGRPVVSRQRRQSSGGFGNLMAICPRDASDLPDSERTRVLFYSNKLQKDVALNYQASGWTDDTIDKLASSGFDPRKPTLIYSFGWSQNPKANWLVKLRSKYQAMFSKRSPTFNLLIFDWSVYSRLSYTMSVKHVPGLGEVLYEFLSKLRSRLSVDMNAVNLIGYSLSTHIVGYSARLMNEREGVKLGQMTLIDPTGVCFQDDSSSNQFSQEFTVRPGDAALTVARHYDMGGLGARQPVGHVDVYVNGGSDQPNSGLFGSSMSSHVQATLHEVNEISQDCQPVAYECSDYDAYLNGECASCGANGESCYQLNTFARTNSKTNIPSYKMYTDMYIQTGKTQACSYDYQVKMKLKKATRASNLGSLTLRVDSIEFRAPTHKLNPQTYTSLVSSKVLMQSLIGAKSIRVTNGSGAIKLVESVEFNYMSHSDKLQRSKRSAKFCVTDSTSKTMELNKC